MIDTAPTATTTTTKPVAAEPDHRKKCTLCSTSRDVLVRCQTDESGTWHFVCVGSCWKRVSGGKEDGDAEHPLYRYGGMWKNKHDAVSAKKKVKKLKDAAAKEEDGVCREPEAPGPASDTDDVVGHGGDDGVAVADDGPETWSGDRTHYTTNDRIQYSGRTWICRKTHYSHPGKPPHTAQNLWKAKARLVEE